MQPYVYLRLIQALANNTSDIDMALHKAQFEAESELHEQTLKRK
jgi:hypothetical protein